MLDHAQKITVPVNMFASTVRESIRVDSAKIDQMLENLPAPLPDKSPLSDRDISIITPIQDDKLASYLDGYDPSLARFLINGFTFGFRIPYQGQRAFRVSSNLSSLKNNDRILQSKNYR